MRRDERVTVQGPVKKQRPDGMSHGGGGGGQRPRPWAMGCLGAVCAGDVRTIGLR